MDINNFFQIINYVGEITTSGKAAFEIFIQVSVSLLIMFALRVILIFKSAGIHFFKEQKYKKQRGIILNHIGIEIIIAFILTYLLLLMINSANNNLIINMIVAPLLGQIVAIFIDDKWFAQSDYDNMYGSKTSSMHTLAQLTQIDTNITQEMIDSEDFRPIVAKLINEMQDIQDSHEEKINKSYEMLANLVEATRNERRIKLKKEMYDCLSKGFITPLEREKIESEYRDYRTLLNGNHDVQELYENHYSKLEVHEERRKQNIQVTNDKRKPHNNCNYGQFDKK